MRTKTIGARLRALAVVSAFVSASACGVLDQFNPAIDDEMAIIIHYRDTTRIVVADTVVRGTPFEVVLDTYGGGCTRSTVRTELGVAGRVALIRPYNRTRSWPGQGCDAVLLTLRHTKQLRVDTPGSFTIRVIGQQRGFHTDGNSAPAELTRVITVR